MTTKRQTAGQQQDFFEEISSNDAFSSFDVANFKDMSLDDFERISFPETASKSSKSKKTKDSESIKSKKNKPKVQPQSPRRYDSEDSSDEGEDFKSPESNHASRTRSDEDISTVVNVSGFGHVSAIDQLEDHDKLGYDDYDYDEEGLEGFVGLVDHDVLKKENKKASLMDKIKVPKFLRKLSIKSKKESQNSKRETKEIQNRPLKEFGDKDTPDRIRRLIKDSYLGNKESQFSLGYCYDLGTGGVAADTELAIQWYTAAAIQGHPVAQNNLGVLYTTGHRGRIEKNPGEAIHWFEEGANKGNKNAAFHAGLAYLNGTTSHGRDDEAAFKFFKIAAKKNHVLAQSNVGAMYMSGRGTGKNYKKAMKWMKKAIRNGNDAVALHNLGVIHEQGYGCVPDDVVAMDYFNQCDQGRNQGIISKKLSKHTREKGLTLYNS